LKTIDFTLGFSTTMSMMANWVFGNSLATFSSRRGPGEADDDRVLAALRQLRSACSRWPSLVIVELGYFLPVAFLYCLGAVHRPPG
jgi:hypothetical protein